MHKKLIIYPYNTRVERHTLLELSGIIKSEFLGSYTRIEVWQHDFDDPEKIVKDTPGQSMFIATERGTAIYSHGHGTFLSCFRRFPRDLLIVTDMLISDGREFSRGHVFPAFKDDAAGIVTTEEFMDKDPNKILNRLSSIVLHEVGHLKERWHHLQKTKNGLNCPMNSWEIPYGGQGAEGMYDAIGYSFCYNCRKAFRRM